MEMRPRCYHFTQCVGVKVAVSTNVTCLPAGFKSFREGMYIYLATWTTLNLHRHALPFLLSIVMSVKVSGRERSPENLTATSSNCWTANPPAQGRKVKTSTGHQVCASHEQDWHRPQSKRHLSLLLVSPQLQTSHASYTI